MNDSISRRAAIKAIAGRTNCGTPEKLREYVEKHYLHDWWSGGVLDALDAVEDMSSAQPEIVFCKDCKYYDDSNTDDSYCEVLYDGDGYFMTTEPDDFCSYAERREENK